MTNAHIYISDIVSVFEKHSDTHNAMGQKAYMKHKFEFHGLKTPLRRELQQPFLKKDLLPTKVQLHEIIPILWDKPQREYQYFGLDLTKKFINHFSPDDMPLLEFMVVNRSWWDTVDLIASHLMGGYFRSFPEEIGPCTEKWMESGNIWLQRSAILFQLKYKQDLDTVLLSRYILQLQGSDEFFINKAIGWILREYSKTDPDWVRGFIRNNHLHSLSVREGSKYL